MQYLLIGQLGVEGETVGSVELPVKVLKRFFFSSSRLWCDWTQHPITEQLKKTSLMTGWVSCTISLRANNKSSCKSGPSGNSSDPFMNSYLIQSPGRRKVNIWWAEHFIGNKSVNTQFIMYYHNLRLLMFSQKTTIFFSTDANPKWAKSRRQTFIVTSVSVGRLSNSMMWWDRLKMMWKTRCHFGMGKININLWGFCSERAEIILHHSW